MASLRIICRCAFILSLAVPALAACTTVRPFPVDPSRPMVRALESGRDKMSDQTAASARMPTVVAVCYNGMVNSDEEIVAEAQLSCPTGRLTLRDDDRLWTRCPLLQPTRANFVCVPLEPPALSAPVQ